jgi:hypothetical protein
MGQGIATGQAAGTAAALALNAAAPPRTVNTADLQSCLVRQGALL